MEADGQISLVAKGDKNTKFFHTVTITRKRNNTIFGVEDATSNKVTGLNMVLVFQDYFQTLFTSFQPDGIDNVVNLI